MINKTIKKIPNKLILLKYIYMRRKETIIVLFMDTIFFRARKILIYQETKQVKQTTNINKFSFLWEWVNFFYFYLNSFPQSTLKFLHTCIANLCKCLESVKFIGKNKLIYFKLIN